MSAASAHSPVFQFHTKPRFAIASQKCLHACSFGNVIDDRFPKDFGRQWTPETMPFANVSYADTNVSTTSVCSTFKDAKVKLVGEVSPRIIWLKSANRRR